MIISIKEMKKRSKKIVNYKSKHISNKSFDNYGSC